MRTECAERCCLRLALRNVSCGRDSIRVYTKRAVDNDLPGKLRKFAIKTRCGYITGQLVLRSNMFNEHGIPLPTGVNHGHGSLISPDSLTVHR